MFVTSRFPISCSRPPWWTLELPPDTCRDWPAARRGLLRNLPEEVRELLAPFVGVVHDHLARLLRYPAHVLPRVLRRTLGEPEGLSFAVGELDHDLLAPPVDARHDTFGRLQSFVTKMIDFVGCLAGAFHCVVDHH